jgi:hypothetical protein
MFEATLEQSYRKVKLTQTSRITQIKVSRMPNKFVTFVCVITLLSGTIPLFVTVGRGVLLAAVYINPAQVTGLNIGDNFTININVANVSNLAGWEIQLFYDSRVVNAIAAAEGPFLKSAGNTIFLNSSPLGIDNYYNSTHGRVYMACAILGTTPGAEGTGTLANVTFVAIGAGLSVLALPEDTTKILNNTPANPQPIPHTVTNGQVSLIANDIAVTNIQLSKTVTSGTAITINVTAANLGNFTVSFNVTLYYDTTEIATRSVVDLAPSTSLIMTFTWDTTPIPKGNYTISAYAPPVMGENYTANNRLIDGWVKKTILGDVNGDGKVNILDISQAAKAFGSTPADPRWEPNGDLDNNGVINIIDITKIAKEWGKTDP